MAEVRERLCARGYRWRGCIPKRGFKRVIGQHQGFGDRVGCRGIYSPPKNAHRQIKLRSVPKGPLRQRARVEALEVC